jgi:hypothetical protein
MVGYYYSVLLSCIINQSFVAPHEMWEGNYVCWIGRHVKAVVTYSTALAWLVSWGNTENEGITHRVAGFWKWFAADAPQMQIRYVTVLLMCSATEL